MKCAGQAGKSLNLSLQIQSFLIVFVLDHPLWCPDHLSEGDLTGVAQCDAKHIVILLVKQKVMTL